MAGWATVRERKPPLRVRGFPSLAKFHVFGAGSLPCESLGSPLGIALSYTIRIRLAHTTKVDLYSTRANRRYCRIGIDAP